MNRLTEDAIAMQEVMDRTAERSDIWQDRCVYAMAKAIYHLLLEVQVTKFGLERRITELEQTERGE